MNSTTIAVDVAKAVFEVAVSEHAGQVRERHRFSRERFRRYLGEQPPATILMEACGSPTTGAERLRRGGIESCSSPRTPCGPTSSATRPIGPTPRACSRRRATTRFGPCPSSRKRSKP